MRKGYFMLTYYSSFTPHKLISFLCLVLVFSLLPCRLSLAADYRAQAEERKNIPVESNSYENWPLGPAIGAQSAILMDAETGVVLYEKNIHEKLYPASITKLLTTYIAINRCEPDERITFSQKAIDSINWWEDANMGVNAGASLPLSDVLYGILVGSANEAAYAVAEHISGSIEEFALLMNETAKELGCTGSNFVTPNGIHDENHYTTAHDMALIAQAFFSNETLAKMSGTSRFTVPVNETQTREGIILTAKSQLLPGKAYAYDYLVGTKTGYTEAARQTLVSCAYKEGMKLICVILKEENPYQFTDTISLFDYGFDNFNALPISELDSGYSIDNAFFTTDIDLLGSSKPILELNKDDYILLPNTIDFSEVTSSVSYDELSPNEIASIHYFYKDIFLGSAAIQLADRDSGVFGSSQDPEASLTKASASEDRIIFINVIYVILIFFTVILIAIFFFPFGFRRKRKRGLRYQKTRRKKFFFHRHQ